MSTASTRPSFRLLGLAIALAGIIPVGCTTPTKRVLGHKFHRQNFRLTDDELKELQFFVSDTVLVQTETPGESNTPTGKDVILVKVGTPGVATEIGPDWIRVSFRDGSRGMRFLADAGTSSTEPDPYFLATATDTGLKMVKNVPGVLTHEGVRYKVLHGQDSILYCEREVLQEILDRRDIGSGRSK
jgi:hypothetical protein